MVSSYSLLVSAVLATELGTSVLNSAVAHAKDVAELKEKKLQKTLMNNNEYFRT